MKKIFRMALVFALAGATLMYTGCTKDYSEDINKLDGEISSLEGKYQDLLNQLSKATDDLRKAFETADTALEGRLNAKIDEINANLAKKADKADFDKAIEDFNRQIAEINAAIAKKADQSAVDAAIDQLKKDLMAKADELQKAIDDVKNQLTADEAKIAANEAKLAELAEAQEKLDDFYAQLSGELRALVFIPDFYFSGIEATSYSVANFDAYVLNPLKADNKYSAKKVTFAKGAKLGVNEGLTITEPGAKPNDPRTPYVGKKEATQKNAQGKDENYDFIKGASAIANYDLNPSSFPIDSIEFTLAGKDLDNVVVLKAETRKWAPKVANVTAKDGVASVEFTIENPDLLLAFTADTSATDIKSGKISVMQATAKLADGKEISSDWAAIVADADTLKHLAFTKTSKYNTTIACGTDKIVLYPGAFGALENDPSISWKYNAGALNLEEVIAIHMMSSVKGEQVLSFAEFSEKYPDFKLNFELVPYTIGDEKTAEDAYGSLEGSEFTPCMVDEEGNSVVIAEKADYGFSAVGRMPMVLVTLTEPKGNEVLHGFFKILIAPEENLTTINEIAVKDFGKLPLLCSISDSTKWYEFSSKVLEALKVNYNQFIGSYKVMTSANFADAQTIAQGSSYTPQLFVKNVDEEGNVSYDIAYALKRDGTPDTTKPLNFGTMTYKVDATGNGVNDSFKWTITPAAAENINKYNELYVLFMLNEYTGAALKFSAEIAEPAEITYGKINPAYWFEDIEAGVQNTVRANILVPDKTTDDVTKFIKNIDEYFVENALKVQLKDESKDVYEEVWKTIKTDYTYKFAPEQPVIDGRPLYVDNSGKLRAAKVDDPEKQTWKVDEDGNYIDGALIATINGKEITYSNATVAAKELLNKWGKEETDPAKMLYANVQVDFTAGDGEECVIAADSSIFHVRFIRPVSVKDGAEATLNDAIPGGDVLPLGKLLSAYDWNDKVKDPIFAYDATNQFTRAYTYPTAAKDTIVWATYYKFDKIKIDFANVETDQTGEFKLLSEVNPAAILELHDASGAVVTSGEAPINVIIDKTVGTGKDAKKYKAIEGFDTYQVFYKNNKGVVKDFNLKIPVVLTYAWGEIPATINVKVLATY